jgi:hypothetical protein
MILTILMGFLFIMFINFIAGGSYYKGKWKNDRLYMVLDTILTFIMVVIISTTMCDSNIFGTIIYIIFASVIFTLCSGALRLIVNNINAKKEENKKDPK